MPASDIKAYTLERREAFIDALTALVRMESPSLVPASIEPVQTWLSGRFEALGYEVERIPGEQTGGLLYVYPRSRKHRPPYQLLLGHCDTVWPVGTLATMPVRVGATCFHGPGAYDMKAGLVQMLFALETLRSLDLTPEVAPAVLISSDEEIGSYESRAHIERLAKAADRALVLEPSLGLDGRIKSARKGSGEFDITITGKAAHSGLEPEKGASAILEMSHVIQTLHALSDPARGITVNVGTVSGGLRRNIVAPESRMQVDVRVPTRAAMHMLDHALRTLQPTTPGVTLTVTGGFDRPPLERTPRNQRLWTRCRRLGAALGLDLQDGMAGGASDGNFTSLHTATLDGLGAVGDGAHALHEFVDIDRTLERTALLALLLLAPPILTTDAGRPTTD